MVKNINETSGSSEAIGSSLFSQDDRLLICKMNRYAKIDILDKSIKCVGTQISNTGDTRRGHRGYPQGSCGQSAHTTRHK